MRSTRRRARAAARRRGNPRRSGVRFHRPPRGCGRGCSSASTRPARGQRCGQCTGLRHPATSTARRGRRRCRSGGAVWRRRLQHPPPPSRRTPARSGHHGIRSPRGRGCAPSGAGPTAALLRARGDLCAASLRTCRRAVLRPRRCLPSRARRHWPAPETRSACRRATTPGCLRRTAGWSRSGPRRRARRPAGRTPAACRCGRR